MSIEIQELFDTPEKSNVVVSNFRTLKQDAGWQTLVKIVEANMEVLRVQLLEGFEEETKEQIDRKRDKLKAYKEVIDTPDFWIKKLTQPNPYVEESDPYDMVETG